MPYFRTWIWTLLALAAGGALVATVVAMQGLFHVAGWIGLGTGAVIFVWLLRGLWVWRDDPRVARAGTFTVLTVLAVLLILLFALTARPGGAIAVAGIWTMGVTLLAGIFALRFVFRGNSPILAVARTLVDEALRMKIALVFVILLFFLVPSLPFLLDAKELLHYRVKFFLTWALTAVSVLLSLMTIFLACSSVSGDLHERQIFLTLTKPVSRNGYLLGKWLGVVGLNLLLITVAGLGIFAFTLILQTSGSQRDDADLAILGNEVLVARQAAEPQPPPGMDFDVLYQQRLERLRREFPEEYVQITPQVESTIRAALVAQWYSIEPRNAEGYLFTGLSPARDAGAELQLRIKPWASSSQVETVITVALRLNQRLYSEAPLRLANNVFSVIPIPAGFVDEQGQLLVEIANLDDANQPVTGSISFTRARGLEVLYRTGSFTPNFCRTLVMLWVRTAFLAALGVVAAAALDFPVAALFCLMVYVGASASGYLQESLAFFAALPREDLSAWQKFLGVFQLFAQHWGEGDYYEALKLPVRLFGEAFVLLIPSFSRFSPVPSLADGRLVSWSLLGQAFFWVGLVWTGLLAVAGAWIFARRELARVTV
ncbi:MAG: ABC transporter permease [Phycisphaeraceae bacterium]|nr:ABC transporter permease [Phycisphaeraceae bacterium]